MYGSDGMSVFLLLYRCGTYLRCKRRYYHRSWEFYCDPAVLPCFSQGKNDRAKDAWLHPRFAGVVVINLMGNSLDAGFRLTGEGFILIAQFSYGMSTVLINIFSRKVSPVVLSGTQFTMGGIILFLIGKGMGGHFGVVNAAGIGIIFYLAMVSAVAYTLWSVLLAWNDVSRVAIFGFVNPLFSVILSALVLGEVRQAFNMGSLIALFLVCVGIYVVNQKKSS